MFSASSDTALLLRQKISQSLESSLDALGVVGIGAVWQQSHLEPIQTLAVTHRPGNDLIDSSPEKPAYLKFSLDEPFYRQLTSQPYRESLTITSSSIGPMVKVERPLPDPITALLSSPLSSKEEKVGNLGQEKACQTSIIGFLSSTAHSIQWIILWHRKSLSPLQHFSIHQQAEVFQQYLTRDHEYSEKFDQIKALKIALQSLKHQLKTPIELIQIHKDLIEQYNSHKSSVLGEGNASTAASLEQIQLTLDNMRHSVKRFTEDSPATQPYAVQDLARLFEGLLKDLHPLIAEKRLSIQQEQTPCAVWVDSWKIMQAFQNLLHNAIAFSPEGGKISCKWECFKNEVLILISDQGPGLVEKEVEEIFLPFYSNRLGGTGLGLTITKQIVLEHRGHIWAETLAGGGTQFSIVLPLSQPENFDVQVPP